MDSFHMAAIVVLTELAAARLERTNPGSVRFGLPYRGGRWSALAILLDGIVGSAPAGAAHGLGIRDHNHR